MKQLLGLTLVFGGWLLPRRKFSVPRPCEVRPVLVRAEYVGGPLCGVVTELYVLPEERQLTEVRHRGVTWAYRFESAAGTHKARWMFDGWTEVAEARLA